MTQEASLNQDKGPESKEGILRGKKVFITGGTSDIGKAIVEYLLGEGVSITSCFRRTSSGRTKAVELQRMAESTGSSLNFFQTDLATDEGVDRTLEELDKTNPGILILNTSGPGDAINIKANQAILTRFLENRERRQQAGEVLDEAQIILMQSHAGHFAPQIAGAGDLGFYGEEVGPYKYEGERLSREKEPRMKAVNARFLVVCPPEAPDTTNVAAFNRRDETTSSKSHSLSRYLGLSEATTTAEVGKKVAGLLKSRDYSSGDTELFDPNVTDTTLFLSRWYLPGTMYVITMQTVDGENVGYYIANPSLHKAYQEPPFMDNLIVNGQEAETVLTVTGEHIEGHPWAFPGHKSIRTMQVCIDEAHRQNHSGTRLVLTGYNAVAFKGLISAGDTIYAKANMRRVDRMDDASPQGVDADARVELRGEIVAEMKGAHFVEIPGGVDEGLILPDQLIEGAAQSLIVSVGKGLDLDNVEPIFVGTSEASFIQFPKRGDSIIYRVSNVRKRGQLFMADVKITKRIEEEIDGKLVSREEEIGRIDRITGIVRPKNPLPVAA